MFCLGARVMISAVRVRRAVGLLVLALAAVLPVAVACQTEEEETPGVTQPAESPTPEVTQPVAESPGAATSPAYSPTPLNVLPSPAAGYVWFETPPNDFGLPGYAVQIPSDWVRSPSGPYYGNPEIFVPPSVALRHPYTTRLITRVTPSRSVVTNAFRYALPRQGGWLCGVLEGDAATAGGRSWSVFNFSCPVEESAICEADQQAMTVTCRELQAGTSAEIVTGRAGEFAFGDFVFSVILFQSEASVPSDAVFEQGIESLTVR